MGFNIGAFAGGLAKSGMETYLTLKDQERKDEEAKQRQDVHDAWKREQAKLAAIDQAATETYGKVGTRQDAMGGAMGPQMPAQPDPYMQQALGNTALSNRMQPDGSIGAAPAGLPVGDNKIFESPAYTQEQASKDYNAKLMGLSPKEALAHQAQALNIESAQQGVTKGKYELKTIKANADLGDWLTEQHTILAEKGPVAALEANLAAYNKDNVHKDGMIASIVKGADGTSSLVRTDEKTGKVKDSTPITEATAQQAIQGMAFNKWKAIPGNFEKGLEHGLKERTVGAQETSAQASATSAAAASKNADTQARETDAKIKADLFGAQATQAKAAANASNAAAIMSKAHAAVYNNMVELSKANKEAGEALKPFIKQFSEMTPEQQAGPEGQAVLLQGATAAAKKSGDINAIITQLKKPDRSQVDPEAAKAAYKELGEAGADPKQVAAVKAKWPMVFGQSALDQAIAAKAKGGNESASEVKVPGRPFYNSNMQDLQRMANKPKGVSSAEANAAVAELQARKGEPRMSSF